MVASLREVWVRGQRKMSQVLGAFGLLDFTMLRPVIAWRAFWNLWNLYFFNFPIFFSDRSKPRIRGSACKYSVGRAYNRWLSNLQAHHITNRLWNVRHDLLWIITTCITEAYITSSFLAYGLYYEAGEKQRRIIILWTFQGQEITNAPYRPSYRRNVPCLQGEWQEKYVVPASGWTENFVVSTVFGQALMPTPLPIQWIQQTSFQWGRQVWLDLESEVEK